jgi:hypothetical protein
MRNVHQLLLNHGVDAVKAMAENPSDRRAVEVAATVLAEEETTLGITHAGFAMTSLPHRRVDEPVWKREIAHTSLVVSSGYTKDGQQIGIPYGSVARMILLYLQTEAVKTNNPVVELGGSMAAWMARMGMNNGGKNYQLLREQIRRLSACRLTFYFEGDGIEQFENGAFIAGGASMANSHGGEVSNWQEFVRLDERFLKSLREHPVPVREEAIRAISSRSMSIDIYIWLAYRLHVLKRPTPVSWAALHGQFGGGFKAARQMKPKFLEALSVALAAYPEALIEVEQTGLILHPSRPAVPKLIN